MQESRNALYTALSSGSRHHSSKAYNSFTWRPDLDGGRAVCDAGNSVYGIHFSNIGHFNQKRKTLELLPEEALYMVERGAIELWTDSADGMRVPMSVQQAWSELLGHDEMTPERYQVRHPRCTGLLLTSRPRSANLKWEPYQVYAFLRRLGYVVTRARPITGAERIVTTKKLPLHRAVLDTALRPLAVLRDYLLRLVANVRSFLQAPRSAAQQVRYTVTRALRRGEGEVKSLLSSRSWTVYGKHRDPVHVPSTGPIHSYFVTR